MKHKLFPLSFLLFFLFVNIVYAQSDVDLTQLDDYLGSALGIGTFAGGLLLSLLVMMMFLLPTLFLCRNQQLGIVLVITILVGIGIQSFSVAISWLPLWTLVIEIMGIAAVLAITLGKGLGETSV